MEAPLKPRNKWLLPALAAGALLAGASIAVAATQTRTIPMTGGDTVNVPVHCHRGTSITGFGAVGIAPTTFGNQLLPTGMSRPHGREAVLSAANAFTTTQNFTALGYCGHGPRLTEVRRTTHVGEDAQRSIAARCPRGTSVMLGGFSEDEDPTGAGPYVEVNGLQRASARSWKASATNAGSRGRLTAIAYCAAGHHRLTAVNGTVTVRPNHTRTATARCPSGHRLVFGGFRAEHYSPLSGGILITALERTRHRAWSVTGHRTQVPAGELTAIAYCSS